MLQDKVAIVTGAGRGIGRAEALALAEAGAAVVVNDLGAELAGGGRNSAVADEVAATIHERGGRAVAHCGDVADEGDVKALVAAALDNFGRLDIVVNNAGNHPPASILPDLELENLDRTLRAHVRGSFCVAIAATRHWREQARRQGSPVDARLIVTASEAFLLGPPWRADYGAAKAAVIALMLSASQTCNHFGVRTNVLCPRADTRMTRTPQGAGYFTGDIGIHSPDNVAPAVVALCGPSGANINGQVIVAGSGVLRVMESPRVRAELGTDITSVAAASAALEEFFSEPAGIYAHELPGGSPAMEPLRDRYELFAQS